MNGDGPFGVPRPDIELTAEIIPGDMIEEIEGTLADYPLSYLQKLLNIFGCSIGDLSRKIAKAKGLKCKSKKE